MHLIIPQHFEAALLDCLPCYVHIPGVQQGPGHTHGAVEEAHTAWSEKKQTGCVFCRVLNCKFCMLPGMMLAVGDDNHNMHLCLALVVAVQTASQKLGASSLETCA